MMQKPLPRIMKLDLCSDMVKGVPRIARELWGDIMRNTRGILRILPPLVKNTTPHLG